MSGRPLLLDLFCGQGGASMGLPPRRLPRHAEITVPWSVSFVICGRAMGRGELKRHRRFLTNFPMMVPPCACDGSSPIGVYGDLRLNDRVVNHSRRGSSSVRAGVETARRLIGAPWMDGPGLTQAIPPVYTEHIGGYLLDHLRAAAVS